MTRAKKLTVQTGIRRIEIWRNESAQPTVYVTPINAYTKESMYCVMIEGDDGMPIVNKFPLCGIHRVVEYFT